MKRIASQKERELLKKIEEAGGVAFRVAGSGCYGGKPDLVAKIGDKYYLIEVKYTSKEKIYLDENQIRSLIEQAEKFGAIPLIAVKFKGERKWRFYDARKNRKKILKEEKGDLDIFNKSVLEYVK